MRIVLATVACTLALASPGLAAERLIARAPVEALEAGGGWVTWRASNSRVFLHDGQRVVRPYTYIRELGTDLDGRGVSVVTAWDGAGYSVKHRPIPQGEATTLQGTPDGLWSADESRGALLFGIRGEGNPQGLYLRRSGDAAFLRVSRLRPGAVSISSGAMANQSRGTSVWAASRADPDRWHLVAEGTVADATADGRFVYWDARRNGRIGRVDPGSRKRRIETFVPPRQISSLAVTGGRLYYTDRDTGALYEFRHPEF